ncbi:MAG TPA: hypothetical protein VFK05_31930 [Polyangiaceae bacterium]|nr:hypothetical protein [Polyangiaceae bacterium]
MPATWLTPPAPARSPPAPAERSPAALVAEEPPLGLPGESFLSLGLAPAQPTSDAMSAAEPSLLRAF